MTARSEDDYFTAREQLATGSTDRTKRWSITNRPASTSNHWKPPSNGRPLVLVPKVTEKEDAEEGDDRKRPPSVPPLQLAAKTLPNMRREKQNEFCRQWTLSRFFAELGGAAGAHPKRFVFVAMLLASLSSGIVKINLKDRIRDGYTPAGAPSRYETDVIREFWNSTGDPMMTLVIFMARDGGSMLRENVLNETERLYDYLHYNFSTVRDGRHYRYHDLCHPFCNVNAVFKMFKQGFDEQLANTRNGRNVSSNTRLTFPVAKIDGFDVHLERLVFGVKVRGVNTTADNATSLTDEQKITNMDDVRVILIMFRGDKGNETHEALLAQFEIDMFAYSLKNESKLVEVMVGGTDVLDQEMMRDGRRMTPYFAAGFGFMISFVSISVLTSAVYYGTMDRGKLVIAAGATLCPVMAITSTYGFISWMDMRVNSFMLVMPFLIMGIGVDDAFLMVHAWSRMAGRKLPADLRLRMVYAEVGPSVTITSVTNCISFSIGALTPTPETRLFCFATAIAMAFCYLFCVLLFGPILYFVTGIEDRVLEKRRDPNRQLKADGTPRSRLVLDMSRFFAKKVSQFSHAILRVYCRLLVFRPFAFVVIVLWGIYFYVGFTGVMNMETRLDTAKILPKLSPMQRANYVLTKIVWVEYHPVTLLVNKQLDFSNATQLRRLWSMIDEFELMGHAWGSTATLFWLRDYASYVVNGEPVDFWQYLIGGEKEMKPVDPTIMTYNLSRIPDFLSSPFYKHWQSTVKLNNNTATGIPDITRFWMTIAYRDTSTWEIRIELMTKWRKIVARYDDLNATVWEPNGMFVDQMLSLKGQMIQTGILTLLCMAGVCALFIPYLMSLLTASAAIASISIGVVGFMSLWHFDLDPIVMAAALMCIGMSVDFTAHISYHFQLTRRSEALPDGRIITKSVTTTLERLEHTIESVGWPMLQAGLSTVICILPLLFLQSYSPSVFVATIFLVVAWGLTHGLLVLPVVLALIPASAMSTNLVHWLIPQCAEGEADEQDGEEQLALQQANGEHK